MVELTPDLLLKAYAYGVFPMAERRGADELFWVDPKRRGVLPIDAFHLSKRLARTVRQDIFTVRINTAFDAVIEGCAESGPRRPETWINDAIEKQFGHLHRLGHAHSVEAWQGGRLVGGLYGVALGGAFFGESMFHRARDASKVALVHLVARLKRGGYVLLDTQFVTEHLKQFGAVEIDRRRYHEWLDEALGVAADFYRLPGDADGATVLQSVTHRS